MPTLRSQPQRAGLVAVGGAAGLVAACDVALAVDGVWFGFTEVRLGLVPATIAPYVIDKIGPGQALLRFLSGDLFDALLAQEIGLIDLAVDEENFDDLVDGWVEELVQGGPQALAACKRLVRTVVSLPREKVDAYTLSLIHI